MDNVLQTALAETVNSLASFFGTTTEAVMTHAPEFLAKYGWYYTLNEMGFNAFISLLIAGLISAIYFAIVIEFDFENKHPVLTVVGIFIICFMFTAGISIITCAVAPEIVGAHAILDLLKSAK